MDQQLFDCVLYRGESETLDFKGGQYSFEKPATDEEKSELLKDVLAFANAWRDREAFILIGINEGQGKADAAGINKHLEDAAIQQFVNSKSNKPVRFNYEKFSSDGKDFGIIRIPVQERPRFALKKYGDVEANTVYIRRGSSTAIANPDEIAKMGSATTVLAATFKVHAEVQLVRNPPQLVLAAWLINEGNATAYDVQINFEDSPGLILGLNRDLWEDKSWIFKGRGRCAVTGHPIHRKDEPRLIANWTLGIPQMTAEEEIAMRSGSKVPIRYGGADVDLGFTILAQHQEPMSFRIQFSRAEISGLAARDFVPTKIEE